MNKVLLFTLCFFVSTNVFAKVEKNKINEAQNQRILLVQEQAKVLKEMEALQIRLNELKNLQQAKQVNIENNKQIIEKNIPLLIRLGRKNPTELLVDPHVGQNALRGIILIRAITNAFKNHITQLEADILEIKAISKSVDSQGQDRLNLLSTIETQKSELGVLEGLQIEKVKQDELDRLANEDDINTLLEESWTAHSKKEKETVKAAKAKNLPFRRLEKPVQGNMIDTTEALNTFSPGSIGVIFETPKNAEVLSASNGTVVFKGPFRDQGEIVIVDHGKKVHSVYMGMDKINAYVGQKVYAREILGTMAGYGASPPKLYFELRQKGKAIDPKPYFAK